MLFYSQRVTVMDKRTTRDVTQRRHSDKLVKVRIREPIIFDRPDDGPASCQPEATNEVVPTAIKHTPA